MKARVAPKYNGLAYAIAVVALASIAMAIATWVPRWLPMALPARQPAAEIQDAETTRIERAVESVRQAALVERTQRPGRGEGGESVLPLYAPSATAAAAIDTRPFDAATLNVVIVESGRERMAIIEGLPVRVGERTAGGGIVRAIERTGVVIEDGTGARRAVDLRDKFVPQDATTAPSRPRAIQPGSKE